MTVKIRRERQWMWHRQAYWPRAWPQLLAGSALALTLCSIGWLTGVEGSWLAAWAFGSGLVGGTLIPFVACRSWKRKHPAMTDEQLKAYALAQVLSELEQKREAAPWN